MNEFKLRSIYKALLGLVVMTILLVIDQFTKQMAINPILNSGFFLGSFQWSSPYYRIFCTVGFLALCVLMISMVQFLMMGVSRFLVVSLALLETGLIGNGIDKVTLGAVRDFIRIPITDHPLVLNFADLLQWISVFCILGYIWKNPKKLWPDENLRGSYFAYPTSQLRMIMVSVLMVFLVSCANLVLLLTYFKVNHVDFSSFEILLCYLIFTSFILMGVVGFTLIWSNRIYGPFRAVERALQHLKNGDPVEIKLRKSDEQECAGRLMAVLQQIKK